MTQRVLVSIIDIILQVVLRQNGQTCGKITFRKRGILQVMRNLLIQTKKDVILSVSLKECFTKVRDNW